jgi:catalase
MPEGLFGNSKHLSRMKAARHLLSATALTAMLAVSAFAEDAAPQPPHETPLSMANALHTAFGDHHARAVHTKGVILEGTFMPAPEARSIVKTPIFTGGPLPVVARFSLFAGVPDVPDNDDAASPVGIGLKIKAADGDFDMQAFNHRDFVVATSDQFAMLLRAIGATKPDSPHPNPVEQFLATHPHAKEFLGSRSYPISYAEAKYYGVNAEKFTNAEGQSVFVRYQFVPRAGERYLSPAERKTKSGSYLQDEIVQRAAKGAILFDWYAQVAQKDDVIEDPSIAWPDTRKLVKLGTFSIERLPSDPKTADRTLLFQPGSPHPGVDPADPMLMMRNAADAISVGERQ